MLYLLSYSTNDWSLKIFDVSEMLMDIRLLALRYSIKGVSQHIIEVTSQVYVSSLIS